MQKYYRAIRIAMTSLIITSLITLVQKFTLLKFINNMFIIGLILLMIGSLAFLREKGYFRVPGYGFKKMFRKLKKKKNDPEADEFDKMTLDDYVYSPLPKYIITFPYLVVGVLLIIVSFIMSILNF